MVMIDKLLVNALYAIHFDVTAFLVNNKKGAETRMDGKRLTWEGEEQKEITEILGQRDIRDE